VARKKWEYASLEWIHRVREEAYRKTKELPLEAWLFMLPFAAAMLLLEEARKLVVRRAKAGSGLLGR